MSEAYSKHQLVMMAVGTAINSWNQVESGMGILFLAVSDIANPYKAGAIFDRMVSFETRLAVLDAAMEFEALISEDEKLIWTNLSARLRKNYKKRHEVAHFTTGTPEDMAEGAGIFPYFTWNKHHTSNTKLLTQPQILERSLKFSALSNCVTWFSRTAAHRKQPAKFPPPSSEEPPLIAHIRELELLKKQESERQRPPTPG